MFSRLVVIGLGVVLALWMSAGRWLFGIGGNLTWWYVPTIGLTYILLHVWLARRMRITATKGKRASRGMIVSLVLSWVNAIAFGITVPDRHDGQLTTIISHFAGDAWLEMAIALCNPFGIIAFTLVGTAIGFAISDSRDPKPEEDEASGPIEMVPHPFS